MSFKRDGDDGSLFRSMQKRRVSDLLVDHIPEDEALLIKNGKYACSVCSYKPVFDTLEVLAQHRKGKKHMYFLTNRLRKIKEDEDLKTKRKQSNNSNEPAKKPKKTNLAISRSGHSLLKEKRYNSCCQRKVTLTIENKNEESSEIDKKSSNKTTTISNVTLLKSYVKKAQKRRNFAEVVAEQKSSYPKSNNAAALILKDEINKKELKKVDSQTIITTIDPETKEKQEYYLKLRASGWMKAWKTGEWIKDEDAEFDSDQEEPKDFSNEIATEI